eukprot:GABV01000113.1.p1 GENE.GABV01000113.1~~GABV01000113.1.p1  ORF type:complete len:248 (-),score=96.99 GABV01000113.1:670-1413(-)
MASAVEHCAQGDSKKAEGNAFFKAKEYEKAIDKYTEALTIFDQVIESELEDIPADHTSKLAATLSNRALAYLRLEQYGASLADADRAIQLGYSKAYYRRASAHMALGHFQSSLKDLEIVVKRFPKDPDAKRKLAECDRIVKQQMFWKAMAREEAKPLHLTMDASKMAIESSYQGPTLDLDQGMTLDYIQALMTHFADQKLIAKRDLIWILLQIIQQLKSLPTLIDCHLGDSHEFTVCGDVHGQFTTF